MVKMISRVVAAACLAALSATAADVSLVKHKEVDVTKADFDAYMERVPAGLRVEAMADHDRNNKVVDLLFTNRMLAQAARAAKLDRDPVMARRIEQHVEAFLAQQYVAHLEQSVAMPPNLEARVRELYLAKPAQWTEPDRVDLQHILVSFNRRTVDMARDLASRIRARAMAGEDFLALAKELSEDPGFKRDGGRLGLVSAKELTEGLAKAAFELKADGDISAPVETLGGFHLVKRVGFQRSYMRKYEDVKAVILEAEQARIRADASVKLLDGYRRSRDTRWNVAAIAALRTEIPREEISRLQREQLDKAQRELEQRGSQPVPSAEKSPAKN